MTSTLDRLSAILARDYQLPPERLTADAPLDGLGIDSLATVELLWSVEDAFKIKLPPEPVTLTTLGDVARHVDALAAAQGVVLPPAPEAAAALHSP